MKTSKSVKIISLILIIAIIAVLGVSAAFAGISVRRRLNTVHGDYTALTGLADKTILFIGDGMGENHVKATEAYYGDKTYFTSFGANGFVTTYSNSITGPTDSAAAASAMATGIKYDNGEVSRRDGRFVSTVCEFAKENGYGVGIVTTDNLYGATPAAFSSHAKNRNDTDEIVRGQISGGIDLYLGAGKDFYDNYRADFENAGYEFVSDLNAASGERMVIGVFDEVVACDGSDEKPTLEMLTDFATDFFERNFPDGYFLMVEGAHIDKTSHKNDIEGMVRYLKSFDESIKNTARKLISENVALIVTADHETGGLKYSSESRYEIVDGMFTSKNHTAANVPYYIRITSKPDDYVSDLINKVIDNTDIYRICKALLTRENVV